MTVTTQSPFAGILLDIADTGTPLTPEDLIARHSTSVAALDAFLAAYWPFGVLHRDSAGRLSCPHEHGRAMLRSLAFCIDENLVLIDDWERDGADCTDGRQVLDRGVCFLSAVEHKRVDIGSARPTRQVTVSKAIIKKAGVGEEPVVLMMLNPASQCYQLIGGKARKSESPEKTLRREISEEITTKTLRIDRDYIPLKVQDAVEMSFVSPTTGAYTKYEVHYFSVKLNEDIKLGHDQRWVPLEEIRKGVTFDGCAIMPSPEQEPGFFRMLDKAPLSLQSRSRAVGADADLAPAVVPGNGGVLSLVAATCLLFLCVVLGILAINHFAPDGFKIMSAVGVLLIGIFAFIALIGGFINGEQFVSLLQKMSGQDGVARSASSRKATRPSSSKASGK